MASFVGLLVALLTISFAWMLVRPGVGLLIQVFVILCLIFVVFINSSADVGVLADIGGISVA